MRLFADTLVRHTREPIEHPFRDWNDAIRHLFRQFAGEPTVVVLDEFPFLPGFHPGCLPSSSVS